jgi:hypothetical protein
MAKVSVKNGKKLEDVGQVILDAWDAAYAANSTNPSIDRNTLLSNLAGVLDVSDTADTNKTIELDVVFDTDLTPTKRLVWLAIPTPDPDAGDDWDAYKQKFYGNLPKADKKDKKRRLGEAVLFGCGR